MPERAEHVAKCPPSCSCIPGVMIHSILFHFYIYLFFFNSVAMWTVLSGVLKRRLAIQTIDDGKTVRYMYCCAHCQAVTLSSGSLQAV